MESSSSIDIASKVLAAAANGVEDMISRYRGDVDRVFARAALNLQDIDNPYKELNLKQYCRLFEEAARQTANDNFGLRFGNEFTPKRLGPIGYIAVNSPTLGAAIQNLVKYFLAHQDHSILMLKQDGDVLYLNYQIVDQRIPLRRQDAELSLGMFSNIFKHCRGAHWAPLEVHFEHPAPDGAGEHERCFGAPILFGQPTNSIVFERRDLGAIMPDADPYLLSIMESMLAERRALRTNPDYFLASIREHIRARLGRGGLTMANLAGELDVSVEALRRSLKAHDVAFQDLVRGARRDLALHYVKHSDMRLTEVALALGYSEQSAFSRAFRHWTGMSPQRYRNMVLRGHVRHGSAQFRSTSERRL